VYCTALQVVNSHSVTALSAVCQLTAWFCRRRWCAVLEINAMSPRMGNFLPSSWSVPRPHLPGWACNCQQHVPGDDLPRIAPFVGDEPCNRTLDV
jgi:hypothetical protein